MYKFKKLLIAVAAVIIAVMVLSAFLPKTYEVNVKQKMDSPANVAYNAVSDFYTWPLWYGKLANDSLIYEQNINELKKFNNELLYNGGIIRLIASSTNDSLLLYDEGQDKSPTTLKYKFLDNGSNPSTIELSAQSTTGYIKNLLTLVYKFRMKRTLSYDLKRLNDMVKDRHVSQIYHGYKIETISMPDKYYITLRSTVPQDGITDFYKVNIATLYQSALNDNLAISGSPVLFKYSPNKDTGIDVAVGLPTLSEVSLKNSTNQIFGSQIAYQIKHEGYSTDTQKAHLAMTSFFKDKNMQFIHPIHEEFPGQNGVSNTETKNIVNIIYYPKL